MVPLWKGVSRQKAKVIESILELRVCTLWSAFHISGHEREQLGTLFNMARSLSSQHPVVNQEGLKKPGTRVNMIWARAPVYTISFDRYAIIK